MHWLLIYEPGPDYLERRPQFRADHLRYAWTFADRGELVLAGTAGDPIEGGILLWRCDSPELPAAFAREDPYVVHGLIRHWRVVPWNTVVGTDAATPLRPA